MGFREAFLTCMRKYSDFSGRASRAEYWWFYLARTLIMLPFSIFAAIAWTVLFVPVFASGVDGDVSDVGLGDLYWGPLIVALVLALIVNLVLLLPSLAVEARRLHDMGQPGWWVLLNFVSLGIVPVVMCIVPPVLGPNEHGELPAA